MKARLIDAGGDIWEGTKSRAGAKKTQPRHDDPDAGELEADVLLRGVHQEVAEEDRRVEFHAIQPTTRGCGESAACLLGSGATLSRLVESKAPLVLPDRRSELKRKIGVVAVEVDETESSNELGAIP